VFHGSNVGDVCWVQATKKHFGICVGVGPDRKHWFVHATPEGGVVCTTRKGFAGYRPVKVARPASPAKRQTIAKRAMSQVGRPYNVAFANCEHLANWAATGKAESPQLQRGVLLTGAAAAAVWGLSSLLGDKTWEDDNGYRRDSKGRFA